MALPLFLTLFLGFGIQVPVQSVVLFFFIRICIFVYIWGDRVYHDIPVKIVLIDHASKPWKL